VLDVECGVRGLEGQCKRGMGDVEERV